MSDEGETTLETVGLDKLLKALRKSTPMARVGVLGEKNSRNKKEGEKSAPTNAQIGAVHEFGDTTHPQRSFLRVPIADNLQKAMENSGAFTPEVVSQVLKDGSVIPWLKKVAILAEGIVIEGFSTGGFGKWAPWKSKGYTNNAGQILVDTTQLRNSITSEVKE